MKPLDYLAREAVFDSDVAEAAHRALSRYPDLHPNLAMNPALSNMTWLSLFSDNPNATIAKALVGRDLPHELREVVIANETRETVLAEFVLHNQLTVDELGAIPSALRKGRLAEALVNATWVDVPTRFTLAERVGLIERIRLVCDPVIGEHPIPSGLLDAAVFAKPVKAKAMRSASLSLLLHRHPESITDLLATGNDAAVTAVAGSPVVCAANIDAVVDAISALQAESRKFAVLALVANPRLSADNVAGVVADERLSAPERSEAQLALARRKVAEAVIEPYKEVSRATLQRLLRRALPSEYRPHGRPAELLAVLGNPELGSDAPVVAKALAVLRDDRIWGATIQERWVDLINADPDLASDSAHNTAVSGCTGQESSDTTGLIDIGHLHPWSLQTWHLASFAANAAALLGPDAAAWETLLSLFNSFTGTVGDLLEVSRSI